MLVVCLLLLLFTKIYLIYHIKVNFDVFLIEYQIFNASNGSHKAHASSTNIHKYTQNRQTLSSYLTTYIRKALSHVLSLLCKCQTTGHLLRILYVNNMYRSRITYTPHKGFSWLPHADLNHQSLVLPFFTPRFFLISRRNSSRRCYKQVAR